MSQDIYINVQRVNSSTSINNTPIHVQKDNRDVPEVLYYEGVSPVERFDMYVYGIYDIRLTDILIDTQNIDPITQTYFRYRVTGMPASYPDLHMECIADLLRGSV